ncbi:MAG: SCP2 sterol-binding domain-containing protein [Planctomycetes bacterium]|nr:SCP2 sterol-binding domain-containing protein [Planctomycetota bacterium]
MSADLKKLFDKLKKRFTAGVLEQDTVYYFSLGEGDDFKWVLSAGPDKCTVKKGKVENADCVLKTTPDIFLRMVEEGYVPGGMDVITGRVKISSVPLMRKLQEAFKLGEAAPPAGAAAAAKPGKAKK